MSFCDINFRRKTNGDIIVKNNRGENSPLYSKLVEYTNQNNVYQGREWFFDKLVEQNKTKGNSNPELALGLYSIAYNSGRTEGYWMNRIDELLPESRDKVASVDKTGKENPIFNKGYTNIKQYVQDIADTKDVLSPLAKRLLKFKSDVPVLITEFPDTDPNSLANKYGGSVAVFDPDKNEIRTKSSVTTKTILHEYIHAVTYDFIRENKNLDEVKELKNLLTVVRSHAARLTKIYPIENLDEFITGIFTNSEFINDLKKIPYKSSTVFSELLQWFKRLFNLNSDEGTLFETVFQAGENLLNRIEQLENPFYQEDNMEETIEEGIKKITSKFGTGYGTEINPYSDWGKLTSALASLNKQFGKVVELYQAPNGKWYVKRFTKVPVYQETMNHVDSAKESSLQMRTDVASINSEITENWNDYFKGYSDLSPNDKQIFADLVEKGFVELTCKI